MRDILFVHFFIIPIIIFITQIELIITTGREKTLQFN